MRHFGVFLAIAGIVVLAAGCGNEPSGGGGGTGGFAGSGGGGGTAGVMLGCNPATYCGDSGFLCGVHAVSACGEVDCGACRYVGAQGSGFGDITAAADGSIHVVLADTGVITYGRASESGLDEVEVATDGAGDSAGIAVAADGTVHIAYHSSSGTAHAKRLPGSASWAVNPAGEGGESLSIAVDAAGNAHIVVVGEDPVTRGMRLLHITESGGTYTEETVPDAMPIGPASLGRGADGSIVLVSRVGIMDLAVFDLEDGSFVRDTAFPTLDDQPAESSVAVASDGTVEVLALLGNYTLLSGSKLVRLTRGGSAWTERPAAEGVRPTHGIALGTGIGDALHLAYFAYSEDGFFYTRPGSPVRMAIDPDCDDGDVRIAVDAADQPHLLYRCDSDPTNYLAPVTRYSDEYVAACNDAARAICDRACVCGSPDCCYGAAVGTNGACYFGPNNEGHDLCVQEVLFELCGDRTRDEAAMLACKPALEAPADMCVDTHYPVPQVCLDVMNPSF